MEYSSTSYPFSNVCSHHPNLISSSILSKRLKFYVPDDSAEKGKRIVISLNTKQSSFVSSLSLSFEESKRFKPERFIDRSTLNNSSEEFLSLIIVLSHLVCCFTLVCVANVICALMSSLNVYIVHCT